MCLFIHPIPLSMDLFIHLCIATSHIIPLSSTPSTHLVPPSIQYFNHLPTYPFLSNPIHSSPICSPNIHPTPRSPFNSLYSFFHPSMYFFHSHHSFINLSFQLYTQAFHSYKQSTHPSFYLDSTWLMLINVTKEQSYCDSKVLIHVNEKLNVQQFAFCWF